MKRLKRKVTFQVISIAVAFYAVIIALLALITYFTTIFNVIDSLFVGTIIALSMTGVYFILQVVDKSVESIMDDINGVTSLDRYVEELFKEEERRKEKGE